MLSVKQGGIKNHFWSFWSDSTQDWSPVFWTIGEDSTHKAYGLEKVVSSYFSKNIHWEIFLISSEIFTKLFHFVKDIYDNEIDNSRSSLKNEFLNNRYKIYRSTSNIKFILTDANLTKNIWRALYRIKKLFI